MLRVGQAAPEMAELRHKTRVMVEPARGLALGRLIDLWSYRELAFFLALRDVKVRYKQTVLGASWAILQPLMTMVIFTIVFGAFAKLPSEGFPYPIFTYTAVLPWAFFAAALGRVSGSMLGNAGIIGKVYFPRLVVPISSLLSGLVDFGAAFLILVGLMLFYGVVPTPAMLLVPLLLLWAMVTALAVGIWFAALSVRFRDVHHGLGFVTQLWLYATPVAYSASLVPENWRIAYRLNPMASVVEGFRWAVLGSKWEIGPLMVVPAAAVLVLLVGGILYFQRTERTFADVI